MFIPPLALGYLLNIHKCFNAREGFRLRGATTVDPISLAGGHKELRSFQIRLKPLPPSLVGVSRKEPSVENGFHPLTRREGRYSAQE